MSVTPETASGTSNFGILIDSSMIQWWGQKNKARESAESIGWPMTSVWPIHTRFQYGYALHQTHGGFLTRAAFARLLEERENDRPQDSGPHSN